MIDNFKKCSKRLSHTKITSYGFTIVELLVVIVVIGILAAITIVSYTGITQRAVTATLQSDLSNSSNQLKIYYTLNGSYPTALNGSYCPTAPIADNNLCLKPTPGNTIVYSSNGTTFSLTETNTNNGAVYNITDSTAVTAGPLTTNYTLTVIAGANGTVNAGGIYNSGTSQTITATPNANYVFSSWSGSIGCSGSTSHTITMDADKTCTANFASNATWIPGIASTALAGKYVLSVDIGSTYTYKTTNDAVTSPQGATGLDPNYPSSMSLVNPQTNTGVDFSAYPAQNACKAIGGRLPNMQELIAIYAGRATYGNNFQAIVYWSSTEYTSTSAYVVYFNSGSVIANGKTNNFDVRCVSDSWLTIGTQTWAKANLNVGIMITGVTTQTNNSILEKYCYNNAESNCTIYGALYQWNEAMQYVTAEGAQGICPPGSHIPSDNDWKILEVRLGMTQAQADATGWRGTNQGTQLKSGGSSGLNMPLAGFLYSDKTFLYLSQNGPYWSSSKSGGSAWDRFLSPSDATVYRDSSYDLSDGFSIRCLMN